jgi:dTDP-4-amino-4,6-dideoxygalactose transaminase
LINVTKTYLPNVDRYQSYVKQIFQSGWLTNNGNLVKRLTKELSEYLEVDNLLLVSNGTLALQLAYKVLELKGQVVTTPFSFVATTSSLVWEGLEPVFADIDPKSLNIDPFEVEKNINNNTSAIVATHVYGNACDVEMLDKLAQEKGVSIIYDAAHAFNAKYKGQSLLKYGDISILSFHSTKIFHTIEGGALVFKDRDLFHKAKKMINFGIESPEVINEVGINCKMNEFQAAMGICVLEEMDIIVSARKQRYDLYFDKLCEWEDIQLPKRSSNVSNNYSHFPVVFPNEQTLLEIMQQLHLVDIFPRRYFYPSLNNLPYIQGGSKVPISDDISKRILCLPLFHDLDMHKQLVIIDIIERVLSQNKYKIHL